ncbi:uncharacterized protein LOC133930378 [Phragmites australis]|uniref:uncharacterized protein LOC133930378 n=1 Tax=Phragmites australis TaxID=29695 RepID=UPI002D7928B2|nr:uncharacterized protein LOC133930378 [Phragmites australis]
MQVSSPSQSQVAPPETKREQTPPLSSRHRPSLFFHAPARASAPRASFSSPLLMASFPARRRLLHLLLLVLLLGTLSSPSVRAAMERRNAEAPAMTPAVAAGSARQEFHVAGVPRGAKKGAGTRRPIREWRRRVRRGRDGGTGAWAFSAMLPRGFVPPSGSSACHNDMPATAVDAQFFACGGAGSP